MTEFCKTNCPLGYCPPDTCSCDENWKPKTNCRVTETYKAVPNMFKWCNDNCAVGNCPKTHCICDQITPKPKTKLDCIAIGPALKHHDPELNAWCETTCSAEFCPKTLCACIKSNAVSQSLFL